MLVKRCGEDNRNRTQYAVGLTVPCLPDCIGIGVTRHCVESEVRFGGANRKTFARSEAYRF